ncbi:MAG TPA: hypothetical protein VLM80_07015, partial [Anaerolineales bacterium]|nr:hypothetical protein [Anaerolineales bacterium]
RMLTPRSTQGARCKGWRFFSASRYFLVPCYNQLVTLKDDLKAYQARWAEVEAVVQEERRSASLELRWQQVNAAYALAKGLGLLQPDSSEMEVFQRWAKLKEKAARKLPR